MLFVAAWRVAGRSDAVLIPRNPFAIARTTEDRLRIPQTESHRCQTEFRRRLSPAKKLLNKPVPDASETHQHPLKSMITNKVFAEDREVANIDE
jgi:hypothetical protein